MYQSRNDHDTLIQRDHSQFPLPVKFSLIEPVKSTSFPTLHQLNAQVVELVDTHDSESCAARCGGSSPPLGTKKEDRFMRSFFVTSGRDENDVRRSDISSGEGQRAALGQRPERSESIPPGHQFKSQVAVNKLLEDLMESFIQFSHRIETALNSSYSSPITP